MHLDYIIVNILSYIKIRKKIVMASRSLDYDRVKILSCKKKKKSRL